jgi:hypothetical protein
VIVLSDDSVVELRVMLPCSDIVGDFVCSLHPAEELRQAHRRLVDQFCASRPVDPTSKSCEWNNVGDTPLSRYVRHYCVGHIEKGWNPDWESDGHAIQKWLGDYPQDDIVKAAATFLGFEKLSKLASKVDAEDTFMFAKLAAAAGLSARGQTDAAIRSAGGDLERRAADALGALGSDRAATEQRNYEERLELETVGTLLGDANPADFKYLGREWNHLAHSTCTVACLQARTVRVLKG